MTRWHFSIHALRHHSALAWLQVPSSSTMPSMSFRMARWLSSISPLRPMATISRSVSRSATLALETDRDIVAIGRKGEIEDNQRAILKDIEGIVLLDGTWSQAKALWWRNAWMLKCQRVILGPAHPSRYGKLRREPRRDGLSTLQGAAMQLSIMEERPDIAETLHSSIERMLAKYREAQSVLPELAPKPKPKRDYRRHKRA